MTIKPIARAPLCAVESLVIRNNPTKFGVRTGLELKFFGRIRRAPSQGRVTANLEELTMMFRHTADGDALHPRGPIRSNRAAC